MDITDQTKDLNSSLEDMKDKTRDLNDSLKILSSDGIDKLSRAVTQATSTGRAAGYRQPSGDIVNAELSKLLREQVKSVFAGVFGGAQRRGGENAAGGGGAGGIQVVIHNNTPAVVNAQQTTDMFNQKQLEITIDQMVASSLVRGQQTTGVLNSIFGLVPGLIGR
jgi:hypothetical protein